MKNSLLFSILLVGLCSQLSAQRLPTTNILAFDLKPIGDSIYQFKNPKFLTGFNKQGYNNQPYFMSDDELYITVQRSLDTTQTDIFALNLRSNALTQVTATVESEYSPTFVPPAGGSDNQQYKFSCVRVEADGQNSQRLWTFPISRANNGEAAIRTIRNVGYHYWIDYRDVLLFLVDNPHKMVIADTRDESTRFITSNVGRCFQELPNGDIAFLHKMSEDTWLLKQLNTKNYTTKLITAALPGSEDFCILGDGTIIMAQGTKLFKFNKGIDTNWLEIGDFSYYGMSNISRLAVNGAENRLVMVIE